MALIQGFNHDIFISYAHVDNKPAFKGQGRWIDQFCKSLSVLIDQRFGQTDSVGIWWDKDRLDGGIDFNDAIADAVNNSAVMVSLNSPGYRKSDYCKTELRLFHTKATNDKFGFKIKDRPRVINVLLDDQDFQHWMPEFNLTTGFHFSEDGFPLETDDPEFTVRMKKLVKALEELLLNFADLKKPIIDEDDTDAPDQKKSEEGFNILLGDVPDTLISRRDRISKELEKSGYKILPGVPPPYEADAHAKKMREALNNADLAVHLMDKFPGRRVDGKDDVTYPQEQAKLSLEASTPTMIWVPEDIIITDIADEYHRQFLKDIESSKKGTKTYDFVKDSQSNIASLIIDSAKEIENNKSKPKTELDTLSVLLDTHTKDIRYASDLNNTLLDHSIRPFLNPNEGEPEKHLDQLEERISRVKKLIFMYGDVSWEWLKERISVALRIIVNGDYNIEDFIIYMSPPFKSKDVISINQRFVNLNIIDGSSHNEIDESILSALKS